MNIRITTWHLVPLVMCVAALHGNAQSSESDPDGDGAYSPVYSAVSDTVKADFLVEFPPGSDRRSQYRELQMYLDRKIIQQKALMIRWHKYSTTIDELEESLSSLKSDLETYDRLTRSAADDKMIPDPNDRPRMFRDATGKMVRPEPSLVAVSELKSRLVNKAAELKSDSATLKNLGDRKRAVENSLEGIGGDVAQAQLAIQDGLNIETRRQAFKREVSIVFAALVALLIGAYFYMIRTGNASVISGLMGDNGLRFVTLFVLIIAVILFGVLGILEGRELAAILSGIAGYILGRGVAGREEPATANAGQPAAAIAGQPVTAIAGQPATVNSGQPAIA